MSCFQLKFVDLYKADRHEFESLLICVEPAPFLQGVFEEKTKAKTLFAVAVQVTSSASHALTVAGGYRPNYNPSRSDCESQLIR